MARPPLLHAANHQAGLLAQARFHAEILAERAPHEAHALDLGARAQQDAVADHAVAQQRGCVVEDDEIDEVAANGAGHQRNESTAGVLERFRAVGAGVVHEDGDVDVTLGAGRIPDPAPEQPGETDRGLGAQAAREVVAQAAERVAAHAFELCHRDSNVADTDSAEGRAADRRRSGARTPTPGRCPR